ncbi:T9SS type A sorting domain-containing protein [Flavobacterium caseinilyticum]|uniref:T9SS type A sorting domain-containing protein n=1 Tax=Flavobacterium caseinilyticum TaxID=2541732 RepID=A0A4R5ATW7_9FLAO|nr:T9SS type A sorting domain-containing protein [Flavobacterium caseinilyticum]TDD76451.1 T9SS type A sorting domain-containing protein [Flavobacterium caseinilyticum]
MKNFTLITFLLVFSIGFAQNAPITFEIGGFGSTWPFASFENGTGAGYSKVSNPFPGGINSSATVGKFVAGTTASGAAPYAGFETAHASGANGIGTFTLSSSNCIVKIMVYKTVISDVAIKFAIADGGAQPEIKVPNTKINEWEELTFDFSGKIGLYETINIDQIIFFLDFNARTVETTSYFDNVSFSAKPTATAPTVAAPTPTKASADVISLFSNAYTNVPVDSWRADWGQSGNVLSDIQIAGNDTKKYTDLSYFGVITEATKINASTMLNFHIDVWTPDVTTFKIKIVDFGADGAYQGGDDKEFEITRTLTLSGWNSLEIPLSEFTGLTTKANIAQFVFSGTAGTIYIDNVYFNKVAIVAPPAAAPYAPVTFETGEYGSTWTLTSFDNPSGASTASLLAPNPNKAGINTSNTAVKFTALTTGAWYTGFETAHASGTNGIGTFTLNETNSTVKMMVYKDVISKVGIKFARPDGGSTGEITVTNTKINEWEELTFNFAGKIGEGVSTGIDQIIIFPDFIAEGTTRAADHVCYIDNIKFSAKINAPVPAAAPTVAAPTPPVRVATDVKSVFSDAYAVYKAGDWCKCWGQSTDVTDELIANNNTRKLSNFNYQGITLPGAEVFDLSDMTTMHVDLWSSTATSVKINLINQGPVEAGVTLTIVPGWNSFDMTLNAANFPGINFSTVFQMSLSSVPAGTTVYLDNFYFYKSTVVTPTGPTVAAPTPTTAAADVISMFSNAYTNVPVTTWRTDWSSGSTLTDMQIAGNDTKKYTNLNYFGVDVTGTINATPMLYFHIDVWTPDLTAFRVKLVDFGANGVYQGGDDVEFEVTRTPTLSGWNSYHIPLSEFTGLTTKGHIAQLVLSGAPAGTVYIDNVYFSRVAGNLNVGDFETSNVVMYPNPVTNYLTIEANSMIEKVVIYNILGQEVMVKSPQSNSTIIQTNELQKGVYIIKTSIDGKASVAKIIKE